MINITKYASKTMDVNSYVLAKENKALIIDPAFNGKKILDHCHNYNLEIKKIILTHGHYDHIAELEELIVNNEVEVYIHADEKDFLYNPNLNLSSMFKKDFVLKKDCKLQFVQDKEKIEFVKETLEVIHLPGHTKGSMGIIYNQHFFAGDTLFFDSIGRTDLPTGNNGQIYASLKKIKQYLPKNATVYPGHGKGGKLSDILKVNQYLNNLY
jgi:glyoxylase-like metal-dependent hydrolase (beta-lactamase superfamily II)